MKTAINLGKITRKKNEWFCPRCREKFSWTHNTFFSFGRCPICDVKLYFDSTCPSLKILPVTVCVVLFLSLSIIYPIVLAPIFSSVPLIDIMHDSSFTFVASKWGNEDIVQHLAYLCSLNKDDYDRIYCVFDFIDDNADRFNIFEIPNEKWRTNSLNKPEEIFSEGSLCRDVAVLFKATCDLMGYESEFVYEPGHIYNKVFIDGESYIVDITINLFEVENE